MPLQVLLKDGRVVVIKDTEPKHAKAIRILMLAGKDEELSIRLTDGSLEVIRVHEIERILNWRE